jgi:DNA replication licensing factor MCM5
MDRGSISTTQVFNRSADQDDSKLQVQKDLENFIMTFRIDNKYVYRWVVSISTRDSHE